MYISNKVYKNTNYKSLFLKQYGYHKCSVNQNPQNSKEYIYLISFTYSSK